MHPILSDKKKLFIYLVVWSVFGTLSGVILASFNGMNTLFSISFTLPLTMVYGEVNLSAWYLCRAFPLERNSIWKILLVSVVSVTVISSSWTLLGWGWLNAIEQFFTITLSPVPLVQTLLAMFGIGVQFFLISIALGYLIAAFEKSKDAERNAYESRLLAQNAELKALRMQIDPHFLFNSLNSISALTTTNPQMARTMTTTLADFFRKSLQYGSKETVSLKEELSLLNHYLDIEKIRFGKRLNVIQTIEPGALSSLTPPLLLQPLVENAIKHGIADSIEGGTIHISAQTKRNRLFISVENPFSDEPSKKKGTGLGLDIVKRRLAAMYGNESDLQSESIGNIFRVVVFFPASVNT